MFPNWSYDPSNPTSLQSGGGSLQAGGGVPLQPSGAGIQPAGGSGAQPAANVNNIVDPAPNLDLTNTTVDPAVAAAQANAAKVGQLRSQVTGLINSVKDIFNSRYGQVDASAGEQVGKLNDRFGTESGDLVKQIDQEGQKVGAAYAGRGTFDSSYRGNDVDTTTTAGNNQIRDLGTELNDNISKIAAWVAQQKTGFDAQKGGLDKVLGHLSESTDPAELTSIRNQIDQQLSTLQAGAADNNTTAQNAASLASVAPSSSRAVQLKTTLSQIIAGNADPAQKASIGARLIASAGLDPADQQKLAQAFQGDLATAGAPKDPNATPTA